jgi:hypothetical protein
MKTVLTASGALILVLVLAGSIAPLHAQLTKGNSKAPATASSSDLFLTTPGPFPILASPVAHASSQLTRTSTGLSTTTVGTGLTAGHVYTLWWIIYDHPNQCAATPCTVADIGNAAVGASVLAATGRIADASGVVTFVAHVSSGAPEGEVLVGSGVFNTARADVQVVVRDHGPASANPAFLQQQLTQYFGCNGNCEDPQMAIHLP